MINNEFNERKNRRFNGGMINPVMNFNIVNARDYLNTGLFPLVN